MAVKNNLKVILAQKNIPQSKLVEDLGINKSTLSGIINGKQGCTMEIALDLAEYFNISIENIFYRERDITLGFDMRKFDVLVEKINKTYVLFENNIISKDQLITLYKDFERNFKERYGTLITTALFEDFVTEENIEINDIAKQVFFFGLI